MELRELRSFCMAARLRSMSKAAERLDLGQPTVTSHVRKLEAELGMTLFDRLKRPIMLTLAGEKLAEMAMPLVEGIDSLATLTSTAEAAGPVSIASTPDIIPHTLLRVVRAYLDLHPHAHLRVRSGTRPAVLQMVRDGEVDMGIVQHAERSDDLAFEGLFVYENVLIAPKGHPLLSEELASLAQLAPYPLILMGGESQTREFLERELTRRALDYEVLLELDSMDMIKKYVALGMGVSVGPRLAIEPEDEHDLGVVSLANLLPVDQGGIVALEGKALSTPAKRFITTMRNELRRHPEVR